MTSPSPVVTTPTPTSPTTSVGAAAATAASSVLGPDAFITLLTAQLQAQDPLNPMDPNQMVDELTSMNTLQETIQMRTDLDGILAAAQGTAAPATTSTGSGTGSSSPEAAAAQAATTIVPNLNAISGSTAAISAAQQYAKAQIQAKF